jgi:hypothetical protein
MEKRIDTKADHPRYTGNVSARSSENASKFPRNDRAIRGHRNLIGLLGLLLPALLLFISWRRNDNAPDAWVLKPSISAYYYSGAVAMFAGLLFALAVFLFTYDNGYKEDSAGREKDKLWWLDGVVAWIAATAAIGVAFFPTRPTAPLSPPLWWTENTMKIHYVSAGALFLMFAVFSGILFPRHREGERPGMWKNVRNVIYYACALVILASIAWAVKFGERQSIFWPESVALIAFAISWLVKGRLVDKTLPDTVRSIRQKVTAAATSG